MERNRSLPAILTRLLQTLLLSTFLFNYLPSTGPRGMLASAEEIRFHIVEEVQMGRTVGSLKERFHPVKTDLASVEPFQFSTMGRRRRYFKLSITSGKLLVAQRIDRDRLCEHKVKTCCSSEPGECHIAFLVQIRGKNNFVRFVTVKVFVADINDNTPSWSKPRIVLRTPEEASGLILTIEGPTDPDLAENGTQRFRLNDPTKTFAIVEGGQGGSSGSDNSLNELKLQIRKRLDREQKSSYNMTLYAVDGRLGGLQNTGSVSILVEVQDINDHSPVFKKAAYTVTISELAVPDALVVRVEANDSDVGSNARIRYEFSGSTPEAVRRTFRLDKTTGEIRLQGTLDYETVDEYKFTVVASDDNQNPLKNSTQVTVKVKDENDCTPNILIFSTTDNNLETSEVTLPENAPPLYAVAAVAVSDCDSGLAGQIHCSLTDSEHLFQLETKDGGPPVLKTLVSFDREKKEFYSLVVRCVDSGQPPKQAEKKITVKILDRNDEAPEFQQPSYTFYVLEGKPSGHQIGRVKAIDRDISSNGLVRYKLVSPPTPYPSANKNAESPLVGPATADSAAILSGFVVDATSGMLSCQMPLDRETLARIDLAVVAYDSGVPPQSATALVKVFVKDENDNTPQFNRTNYRFRLKENSEAGTVVGRVWAFDADEGLNAKLTFEIDKRKGHDVPFVINKVGSQDPNAAELMTKKKIDRESIPSSNGGQDSHNQDTLYVFEIIVTDQGVISKRGRATVTVDIEDVNDRSPEWVFPGHQNTWVNVTRYAEVGHPVAIVKAVDKDAGNNAKIHYSIVNGDSLSLFILDPQTGALQIRRPLDEKDRRKYNLVLKAQDNPGGLENETRSKTTVLKVRLVETGRGGSGNGLVNRRGGGDGRNMTIILALVGCTATIAFILILIIVITRLLVLRRPRSNSKTFIRHGPSTLSHIGGPGSAYPVEPIFSMHTKSQSGHTLADANSNKQEIVYYSTEALDREELSPLTLKQLPNSERGKDGKGVSMEGLCDMNRSWLGNTRMMGNPTNTYGGPQHRYNELDVREYTALHSRTVNRGRSDSIGHYYDLVKTTDDHGMVVEPPIGNDYSTAVAPQQSGKGGGTLRGRSMSNLDKRAFFQPGQQPVEGGWRVVHPTGASSAVGEGKMAAPRSGSETAEMLGGGGVQEGGGGGDIKTSQDLANYRARAKQSLYQASFV